MRALRVLYSIDDTMHAFTCMQASLTIHMHASRYYSVHMGSYFNTAHAHVYITLHTERNEVFGCDGHARTCGSACVLFKVDAWSMSGNILCPTCSSSHLMVIIFMITSSCARSTRFATLSLRTSLILCVVDYSASITAPT